MHLVPDVDELRECAEPFLCGECELLVRSGDTYRHIEGSLDDGSVGRWLYRAHDGCYALSTFDHEDNDGCFVFGGIQRMSQ